MWELLEVARFSENLSRSTFLSWGEGHDMLHSLEVIDVNLVCGKFAAKLPIIFQLLQGQRGTFLCIFGQKFVAYLWHLFLQKIYF